MKLKLTVIPLLLLLSGCQPGTGEFSEEVLPEPEPPAATGDLLSQMQDTIFTPICIECHTGSQAPLGLRLDSTDAAYEFLVDVPAVGNSAFNRVAPNDSENSFLFLKVTGDSRAGQRMPLGKAPLSAESIQLIQDWIDSGALPADSSKNLTTVNSVKPLIENENQEQPENTKSYEIVFNNPINTQFVTKENLSIYQNVQNEQFLIPQTDYELKIISPRTVSLRITNLELDLNSLSLVINDLGSGILDFKGRIVDGDNNGLEGGRYEYQL